MEIIKNKYLTNKIMEDQKSKDISNSNYWILIMVGIMFVFTAILFTDILSSGENIAVRVLSLSGVVFCIAAVLYNDYRLKNYEGLKNRALAALAPIIAALVITAVFLIWVF
jgi:hypothetical protein